MGEEVCTKFTWVIKNFSSLKSENIYSDVFVAGGCRWRLCAFPKGQNKDNNLSLYLHVADSASLPSGWRRHAKFYFTIVNHITENLSKLRETDHWFDEKGTSWGFPNLLSSTKLNAKNSGFLVNHQVKIIADVSVIEVVGKIDVQMETIEVNGFHVLLSQVESVKSLFEKHPDIASHFRPKNPQLRTTYLNVLLSLTEILCKSSKKLSNDDLADAYSALRYVTKAGFKLDWLEKNLKEAGKTRRQEIEEESKNLKRKYADRDALLEFLG